MSDGHMNTRNPVVYVIDDDASVRGALRNLLESVALAVETYGSPEEFLNAFRPDSPGCLILDIRLPEGSGLDFQTSLINTGVQLPVIFITGHGDVAMSVRAMKAGALEFLTKPFREQELLDAVYHAIECDRADRERQAEKADIQHRYTSLTRREIEVMELVVAGMSNKRIGAKIGIQQATVKFHRGRVMAKMRAGSVPDLVRMAERLDLTGPQAKSYATNG